MSIKAVISAAGFGTRFFPLTKAVNKCMLAIGNLPVIYFLINELMLAQVRQIAFVALPGDDQLHRYFTESPEMRQFFIERGWPEKYLPISDLHRRLRGLDLHWIEQPMDGR